MALKETLLMAMRQDFLGQVLPPKMRSNPSSPLFFTDEQEEAMCWEARMQARAMHRVNKHTSVEKLHTQLLNDMKDWAALSPEHYCQEIVEKYRECMSQKTGREQLRFEDNYVVQKVRAYEVMQYQKMTRGR